MKSLAGGGKKIEKTGRILAVSTQKKDRTKTRDNVGRQQAARDLRNIECQIEQLEDHIKSLEDRMARPGIYENAGELAKMNAACETKRIKLEELMEKWEALA